MRMIMKRRIERGRYLYGYCNLMNIGTPVFVYPIFADANQNLYFQNCINDRIKSFEEIDKEYLFENYSVYNFDSLPNLDRLYKRGDDEVCCFLHGNKGRFKIGSKKIIKSEIRFMVSRNRIELTKLDPIVRKQLIEFIDYKDTNMNSQATS